jgi:hypothetical protein
MLPIPLRKKSWFIIDVGTMARQRRSGFIALLTAYLLLCAPEEVHRAPRGARLSRKLRRLWTLTSEGELINSAA